MLADLKEAHRETLAAIEELELLVASAEPDEAALARARYRLGRASGRKRMLVDQLCLSLRGAASPAAVAALDAMRAGNVEMLTASSRHIGTWTLREVMRDWQGYRTASAATRQTLRNQVTAEQRLLYPLLERTP